MPRAALAGTTFAAAAAATTSLLPATAILAGHVPIGEYDVVPDPAMSDSPVLVGDVVAEREVDFAIDDWVTGKPLVSGTVWQRVLMEAEKQSITFHYLIAGAPPAQGATGTPLLRASAFSFGQYVQTDVGYLIDDAAAGKPSRVGRTDNAIDASFDGSDGALGDGEAISFFVRTNATEFDTSGLFAVDALAPAPDPQTGSAVRTAVANGMYRAIVPGPVIVPLPGAVYTGAVGLAAVAWMKRRRKAKGKR